MKEERLERDVNHMVVYGLYGAEFDLLAGHSTQQCGLE
jgi:hypothetical protein